MPKRSSNNVINNTSSSKKPKKNTKAEVCEHISKEVLILLDDEFSTSWAFENWPKDEFSTMYTFCKSLNSDHPLECLKQDFDIIFVGPMQAYHSIMQGHRLTPSANRLAHHRFYHDTPQLTTIIRSSSPRSGFHICYFKDLPFKAPTFLCSNDSTIDGKFKIIGTTLIHSLITYLKTYPNTKKRSEITEKLSKLDTEADFNITKFKKKWRRECDTLNGLGIEPDPRKLIIHRPVTATKEELKKILHAICSASEDCARNKAMCPLDELLTYANISNDECDFGQSLELGFNLLSYHHSEDITKTDCLNPYIKNLLCMAYMLGNVPTYKLIVEKHFEAGRPLIPSFNVPIPCDDKENELDT